MRILHRGHRHVAPFHPSIRTALDKVNARHGRQAHEIVHREDLCLPHQTINHEPVLLGINIPPALMVALKVQTIGRDDPKERLQWGETYRRRSHTGKAWTLASL